MQPLQPLSIKLVISLLRIRFVKAFNVLADLLSAVGNFPHSLGPKIRWLQSWVYYSLRASSSRGKRVYRK